jgi:predicted HTH transcriptional regulator
MTPAEFISYLDTLIETTDVECKSAQGRDGRGEIPESIWPTYSAMANTIGGDIFLGVEELKDHRFVSRGIKDIHRVRKSFWDTINNPQHVNMNILSDSDVVIIQVEGLNILHIHVPRVRRQDRPIHLKSNPFGNTYLRRHEGDYRVDDESIKRMLAEAVEDSRDNRILEDFGIDDLDQDIVNSYRNRFSALKPTSPWLDLPVEDFLFQIGAMGKDRQTGKKGLRIAGLLMFGRYNSIKEYFPYYMVDYQERPEPEEDLRWIDRIIPDDTWSGNLYDFYQKVIRKLTADLKIPFKLQESTRIDDTPIHQAIREALTNTLIHADYTGRVSLLVVKRPDMFGFRNPGRMRVSVEQALAGGISDCRNHVIQNLFRYVGLGDHAGSGIPSILKSWQSQHWRTPLLYEDPANELTLLELRTLSLLPDESVQNLHTRFGNAFLSLSELQRIALITAETEGYVSHSRMRSLSTAHSSDLSSVLTGLVKDGFLDKEGETRASIYSIKGTRPKKPFMQDLYPNSPGKAPNSPDKAPSSPHLAPRSPHLAPRSPHLTPRSPHLEALLQTTLTKWGLEQMPGRLSAGKMKELIIHLCNDNWLSLAELSQLLDRGSKALQLHYLSSMVAEGTLQLKYPKTRNHPDQAYRAKA